MLMCSGPAALPLSKFPFWLLMMKCKKITQGAVYPLASLSIPLSWLIPEYCSHFRLPLLHCQVALPAFLTQFQGGGFWPFWITQVHQQRAIISIFLVFSTKSHTEIYRLWKKVVSFSTLEKLFIWYGKLYSLVALNTPWVHESIQFISKLTCPAQCRSLYITIKNYN